MSEQGPAAPEGKGPQRASVNWSAIAPAVAFVVIIALGLVFYLQQEAQARREAAELRQQARQLGLPEDYPLSDIPLYPEMRVTEAERKDAVSSDDRPMDAWEVHATTADDKKAVFDFYKEKLLGRGMGQQQYISIPTGLQATYADERYQVEVEVEKLPSDEATRIVVRVYRIR